MKANCAIELALDECVAILNYMRRHKRNAERAVAVAAATTSYSQPLPSITGRFSASRRIPSWNCIAQENSFGSLEDELASLQQGASGISSAQNHSGHDGSDSESETIDHNNTWTRSGGPLMRTASASKFVDFIQNLDMGSGISRGLAGELNSAIMQTICSNRDNSNTNASVTVTEGDVLQPEMTPNGIVLNVMKMDEFSVPTTSNDSEGPHETLSPGAECVQLDCPDREMDTSSASEFGDDDTAPKNGLEEVETCMNQPSLETETT